ncbi:TIGR00282 family metallophosphoesterase [Alphaproteobacteria bacterium]|nr:TIGR00282 family metallophosphoesterase [Alphaproteobacteria bacterium]
MKILFIGDIFGRQGREALQTYLPTLKEKHDPDIVICNGENAAHGLGINPKYCKEFYEWGVDVITTGNHIWDQREIIPYIDKDPNLLRPINYPKGTPGNGSVKYRAANGQDILVINVMGGLFMNQLDDPFQAMKELLEKETLGKTVGAIFVDIHAEATSEKMAMGHYLDGKISAIIGTHTHIPTADHHIMVNGTAFMADAGMTGDYDSIIGVQKEIPLQKFTSKMPGERFRPSSGEATLCGALVITDDKTGLASSIEPIRVGGRLSQTS